VLGGGALFRAPFLLPNGTKKGVCVDIVLVFIDYVVSLLVNSGIFDIQEDNRL